MWLPTSVTAFARTARFGISANAPAICLTITTRACSAAASSAATSGSPQSASKIQVGPSPPDASAKAAARSGSSRSATAGSAPAARTCAASLSLRRRPPREVWDGRRRRRPVRLELLRRAWFGHPRRLWRRRLVGPRARLGHRRGLRRRPFVGRRRRLRDRDGLRRLDQRRLHAPPAALEPLVSLLDDRLHLRLLLARLLVELRDLLAQPLPCLVVSVVNGAPEPAQQAVTLRGETEQLGSQARHLPPHARA